MSSCYALPCSPGERPTYVIGAQAAGPPMEVWADFDKCTRCLSPCDFVIDAEGKVFKVPEAGGTPTAADYTGTTIQEHLGAATEIIEAMVNRLGYYYGVCPIEYRPPCRCGCPGICTCGASVDWVELSGEHNVTEVTEVNIGGTIVPEFAANGRRNWELLQCRWLVKRNPFSSCLHGDGAPCGCADSMHSDSTWPSCQRTDMPWGDPCAWGIRYKVGTPVPIHVRDAVQCVACKRLKACLGVEECGPNSIPGVEAATQLGVTVTLGSLQRSLDNKIATWGCEEVQRMLTLLPEVAITGWLDPLGPCNPADFLFQPRRL